MRIWSFIIGWQKLIFRVSALALGGMLLGQVAQVVAQGPDGSPTMDFLEFLGNWNDDEGNFIDPMLLDAMTDLDHPIPDRTENLPQVEGSEGSTKGYGEESLVDRNTQRHENE